MDNRLIKKKTTISCASEFVKTKVSLIQKSTNRVLGLQAILNARLISILKKRGRSVKIPRDIRGLEVEESD